MEELLKIAYRNFLETENVATSEEVRIINKHWENEKSTISQLKDILNADLFYNTEVRRIVYNQYKGKCAICGNSIKFEEITIDHIIPASRGGGKDFSNMQCDCDSCNCMKHYLTWDEFMRKLWKVMVHNIKNIFKVYAKGGMLL